MDTPLRLDGAANERRRGVVARYHSLPETGVQPYIDFFWPFHDKAGQAVFAARVEVPFEVRTGGALAAGGKGDYLVMDGEGGLSVVARRAFAEEYRLDGQE